jgi:histidyl-tRNA synthetase
MEIARLPGFRDFYPEQMRLRQRIFAAMRRVATRYGFEEYDGPPLETLELLTRKSGEEIVGQLYAFTDKGGREVALRPEMTPTLARMVAARIGSLPQPLRWFSLPQLFRYERQQRGRMREHFQLNMDILGEASEDADAELIAAAIEIQRDLGLGSDDIVARISDRRLLRAVLLKLGVPEENLLGVFGVVDKRERMPDEKLRTVLAGIGLDDDLSTAVLETTALKGLDALEGVFPGLTELDPIKRCLDAIDDLGLSDYAQVDLTIVRGLAYYTGIVFECFDRAGKLRAICGGGRYDNLLGALGGRELPALGFGMGDVVLGELLKEKGLADDPGPSVDVFVVGVSAEDRSEVRRLASELREAGRSVAYDFRVRGVGRQLKAASSAGARFAAILGGDETARGVVKLKDMDRGEEREVERAEVAEAIGTDRAPR